MKELGNYECEGQMNIFDFLNSEAPKDPEDSKPVINDFWHEVPSVLPTNRDWMKALFVIYDKNTNEFHYNMPGYVKDKTFKRTPDVPAGEVIAWRYVLEE